MNRSLYLFLIVLIASYASASSLARYNFDLSANSFQTGNAGQFYTSTILIEIVTNEDSFCKYSSLEGIQFEYMEGSFDRNSGSVHQKTISNQDEGSYRHYVRCQLSNGTISTSTLQIDYSVYIPASAQIVLSDSDPLKAGKYEVTLITSKDLSEKPSLKYSIDGIVYNPISLYGSGKVWKGYFIVAESLGEVIGSFQFSGVDLSGRTGNQIEGSNIFLIDTIKPEVISDVRATGMEGQIKLEWYYEEEMQFKIYKSSSSGVDYTYFYETTGEDYFTDTDVEKGKTYYYKIAAVDDAGNVGDLSKEIKATALLDDSVTETGLDAELIGYVDNVITEISFILDDANSIKDRIYSKDETEKKVFENLGIVKEIDSAISELNAVSNDIEKYKLQSLTKDELEKKLNSAEIKINIIKGKIPDEVNVGEENSVNSGVGEEIYSYLLAEFRPEISESDQKKSLKETASLIEENNLKIESYLATVEIIYLDGAREEKTLISHSISSEIDNPDAGFMLLSLPFDIASKASDVNMINLNFDSPKENAFFSFESDTKEITYFLDKKVDKSLLNEIKISPVVVPSEVETISGITGYTILGDNPTESAGIAILVVAAISLLLYFVQLKRKKEKKSIDKRISKLRELKNKGKDFSKEYQELKEEYKTLSMKEKEAVYEELKKIVGK